VVRPIPATARTPRLAAQVPPLSEQVLRRDFADTRRYTLQLGFVQQRPLWEVSDSIDGATLAGVNRPIPGANQRTVAARLPSDVTLAPRRVAQARLFGPEPLGQDFADSPGSLLEQTRIQGIPAVTADERSGAASGPAFATGLTDTPLELAQPTAYRSGLPVPISSGEQRQTPIADFPLPRATARQGRHFPDRPMPSAVAPPTRGGALTVTLLDLTRQAAHRPGLPRPHRRWSGRQKAMADVSLQRMIIRQAQSSAGGERSVDDLRPMRALGMPPVIPPPPSWQQAVPAQAPQADFSQALILRQMERVDLSTDEGSPSALDGARPSAAEPVFLAPGAVARSASRERARQQVRRRMEPVSALWRSDLLKDEWMPISPSRRDVTGPVALSGDDLLGAIGRTDRLQRTVAETAETDRRAAPAANAVFAPLELALNRLLGRSASARPEAVSLPPSLSGQETDEPSVPSAGNRSATHRSAPGQGRTLDSSRPLPPENLRRSSGSVGRIGPRQTAARALDQLEAGGWRFKRSRVQSAAPVQTVQRALAGLTAGESRPIPERPRTLLERVLQRDFAGVRVQMASLGPLGIEAAAQGNTVYLGRDLARLDRPESLALLGHELTHIAASGAAPLLAGQTEQRVQRADEALELPLARSVAHSLSRRLSRQLVQMSLSEEENVAELVENAVRRGVDSGAVQRRSSPPQRRSAQPASIDEGSRSVARLAQRRLAISRFDPVSQSWPGQSLASVQGSAAPALELLEEGGWRFKRSEQASASAQPVDVQRAAAALTARPSGGMPLPVRPRTLMERVLQRDFSGVRLQAAGLEPLGVEAAARGQTVYLQRSALAQLERPDNLALLGHELTHVAVGANPPVRRSEIDQAAQMAGEASLPMPLSLPPVSLLQRSVAQEEAAAGQVEQGIQRLLRQSAAVQRDPLAPRPANGPVKANGSVKANGTGPAAGPSTRQGAPLALGSARTELPALPVVQRRTVQGQPLAALGRSVAEPDLQRAQEGGSLLAGVQSDAMPVVRRFAERQSREPSDFSVAEQAKPEMIVSRFASSSGASPVQRARSEDASVDTDENNQEPDWDRLAEMIYPLIVRMMKRERERRPL